MTTPTLVRHDPGCRWGRLGAEAKVNDRGEIVAAKAGGGHSDAAKRFADVYNLHRAAGLARGWIAVSYSDGRGGLTVYDTRAQAVAGCWPYEDRFFYATLAGGPSMTVCAAESVLRFKRIMAEMERPDRDMPAGGLEVIPRLAIEDQEAQIRAVRTGKGAIALGYRSNA